jgi:tRNA (pseudouridine54-N1)-methyltransferase
VVAAAVTRTFVIVGRTARADERVRLDDLAGTSGRLDVLARCLRAALCLSHGIRRNVIVHLVLLGGARPVSVRVIGADAKFIRPDERALANTVLKAVARHPPEHEGFLAQRNGIAVAWGGLDVAIADAQGAPFVLAEGAPDMRPATDGDAVFFIGDHFGFDEETWTRLAAIGARQISVGPLSLHSDDVVALVSNELDRVTSSA